MKSAGVIFALADYFGDPQPGQIRVSLDFDAHIVAERTFYCQGNNLMKEAAENVQQGHRL